MDKRKPLIKTPGLRKGTKPHEWQLEVCIPGTKGKIRKRKTIVAENRAEALAEWSAFRRELVARDGRAKVWTVRTYVEAHAKTWAGRYSKHGAVNFAYRCSVLVDEMGEIRLDRVTQTVVRDLAARLAKRFSPSSVNGFLATLRRILRDAVDRSELVHYPIRGRLPLLRVEPLRLEMTDEERAAFLASFDDEEAYRRELRRQRVARISPNPQTGISLPDGRGEAVEWAFHRALKPLFVVALETGLAKGDLLSLTWPEVAGPVIRRPRAKTHVECEIPVSAACRAAFDELKKRTLVGKRVFVSPLSGRPLVVDTVNRHFRLAKTLAGITRRLRFHDLRHTFASRLASAGVSLQVIARALGHTSIAMSQRYARPSEEAMRVVLSALANDSANSGTSRNGGK